MKIIFKILVAEEFRTASYLLPWMILTGGFFATGQTLASKFLSQANTRSLIVVKVATALLGLALNVVGAYWYGIKGVVCAGLAFSFVYFLWVALLVKYGDDNAHRGSL